MRAIAIISLLVVFFVLPIASCSDDDNPAKPKEPTYKSLSADQPRDNVLRNLQQAYNDRNLSRHDELLDAGFVFYFSNEDVLNGSPEYWGRATEINANKNMFDPNYANPNQEPVQDIDLVLTYTEGDDEWAQITPEDQVTYPGETWHEKTVTYNLTVQLPGDFQYVGLNKQAAFTVRVATKDSKQYWQIVVWRDDTGAGFRNVSPAGRSVRFTEETTWGQVKARYTD